MKTLSLGKISFTRIDSYRCHGFMVKVGERNVLSHVRDGQAYNITVITGKVMAMPRLPLKVIRAYWTIRQCFPMFYVVNQWCCDTRRTFAWYKTWSYSPASNRRAYREAEMSTDGGLNMTQISLWQWLKLAKWGSYRD